MSGTDRTSSIWVAIATALAAAAIVGLVNGILIGGLRLNALIVTLGGRSVVVGVVNRYEARSRSRARCPTGLSDWVSTRFLGVSPVFWIGVGLTLVLVVAPPIHGGRPQVPGGGGQSGAAHVAGLRVNLNQILVYVVAAVFYAIAGVALAGLLAPRGSPSARRISWARSRRW